MKWLYKLERVLGRFAIRNLMKYIVALNIAAFVFIKLDPTYAVYSKLMLIPDLVFKGEVWRLVSFIFIPPSLSIMWGLITLYFYYMVGTSLENEWGTVRFNMYYFLGILSTIAVSLIFGAYATPVYINLSLFLAFARIYPNFEILVFFILPVKIKYLAMLQWAFLAFTILTGDMSTRLIALVSIINYFVFFGADIFKGAQTNRQVHSNRQRFKREIPREFTYHRCTVCGKTEKDDPKMEFRYCNICEGDYEYCMDHIRDHEHKKLPSNVIEFKSKQE